MYTRFYLKPYKLFDLSISCKVKWLLKPKLHITHKNTTNKCLLKQNRGWGDHTEALGPFEDASITLWHSFASLCVRTNQDYAQRIMNWDQCTVLQHLYQWWRCTVPLTITSKATYKPFQVTCKQFTHKQRCCIDKLLTGQSSYFFFTTGNNSPTVCAVLVQDSWDYCSGEHSPTAQHIYKVIQSFVYSWTMYITKNLAAAILLKFPCHETAYYRELQRLLFNKAIWGIHWKADVGLCWAIFQQSSANTTDNSGTICLVLGRAMAWQPNISAWLYIGQCLTITNNMYSQEGTQQHTLQNPGAYL